MQFSEFTQPKKDQFGNFENMIQGVTIASTPAIDESLLTEEEEYTESTDEDED